MRVNANLVILFNYPGQYEDSKYGFLPKEGAPQEVVDACVRFNEQMIGTPKETTLKVAKLI